MPRLQTISLGTHEGDARQAALEQLAEQVIPDDQAGQRGAKLSTLFQRIADAYTQAPLRAVALLRELLEPDKH
jgi:hypothetical protein